MRTIKFRGKRTDGQDWVHGDLLHDRGFGGDVISDVVWIRNENNKSYQALPESVCQFINRTDKWGKEIYVGDTVEGYYIDQIYGCSVSKVLIKIEQYEDVVKLDELDSFAVLMEVE